MSSSLSCEQCPNGEGKYCCPACGRRTCSVACVRAHKEKFGCSGLRPVPTAPVFIQKYDEQTFLQDYTFLEGINEYTTIKESERNLKETTVNMTEKRSKAKEFKKIQRLAKLTELRLLPEGFSRSKRNRTHIKSDTCDSERNIVVDSEEKDQDEPEKKSSRRARVSWTIDLVEYPSGKLMETRLDVLDDTRFSSLLIGISGIQSVYLRNETRHHQSDSEKWRLIPKDVWEKSVAQVLVGGRIFEYPQIGIDFNVNEIKENDK